MNKLLLIIGSVFIINFVLANPFGYNYLEQVSSTGTTDLTDYYTKLQVNAINTSMKNYVDSLGGGGISWATATNGTLRLTNNHTFLGNVTIGTNNSLGLFHVDGGFDNNTLYGNVTELGGYICNGLLSFGTKQNLLIQTEQLQTSWTAPYLQIVNNSEWSPAYTQTAEVLNSTSVLGRVGQITVNKTNSTTWVFSVWLKSQETNTEIVSLEINSSKTAGTKQNVTVGWKWERYAITQTITDAGTGIGVNIYTNGNNISAWGTQLEMGTLRCYSGALTTTNQSAFSTTSLIRSSLTVSGAGSFVGVAVGGALSGATTGAFTGAVSMAGLTATTGTFSIANNQWGNTTGLLLNNPTLANSTHKRFWVQNPPALYFNGTSTNGTGNFKKISSYRITMNITNGTIPTNDLIFQTIWENGGGAIYTSEILRLNDILTNLNSSLLVNGSILANGTINATGDLRTNANLKVDGNVNITGNLSVKRPYGMFSSTESQNITSANTPFPITFNWTEDAYQLGITDSNTNFTFQYSGDYLIELSAIVTTLSNNKHIQIWVQKNGINVPRSNTRVEIENAGTDQIIAVPFILDVDATTDKFRFMMASDDLGTILVYTTNTSYSPESPSVIVTMTKISEVT